MVLSRLVFKARYRWQQMAGVGLSLLGIVVLVVADLVTGRANSHAPNPALGDMLCLLAATLYGVSNVIQEFLVKESGGISFLAVLGIMAVPVSALQSGLLEGHLWVSMEWTSDIGT